MSLIITVLFMCAPFIAIPALIIGIILDKKHNIIYGILLALLLAIIAYNFIPQERYDLYRYYFEINNYYKNIGIEKFIDQNMFNNSKFLFVILEFFVAKVGNNNLLPFIITFIGYSITFGIILDYAKLKNIKPRVTILILFIFMMTFYHINFISGLAQFLAITIGFLAFYLEYVRKKNKWYFKIFYIIAPAIHLSMIIILIIRFLLFLDFKKYKKFYLVFLAVYALLPSIFYYTLVNIPQLQIITNKIYSYMLSSENVFTRMYDIVTLLLLIFYLFIYYTSKKKIEELIPDKFMNFIEIILLLNISSVLYVDIFSRILNITMLCMNIYLLGYFKFIKKEQLFSILLILLAFCIVFGSVNLNNILDNDFGILFSGMFKNIVNCLTI